MKHERSTSLNTPEWSGKVSRVPTILDRLVSSFSKLPGIGKKSATRIVYHILAGDSAFALKLAEELAVLHKIIQRCEICGGFTESNPCPICSDSGRNHSIICVVEKAQDIRIIEEAHEFNGIYHVLGGLIAPLEGISPGDLTIGKLISRIKEGQKTAELILALNPTLEGDTTALYLQKILKEYPIDITRLASGLPVGGDLEYTDRLTLSRSFRGRTKL